MKQINRNILKLAGIGVGAATIAGFGAAMGGGGASTTQGRDQLTARKKAFLGGSLGVKPPG